MRKKRTTELSLFTNNSARKQSNTNTLEMPRQYFRAPLCLFPWSTCKVVISGSGNIPTYHLQERSTVRLSSKCSAADSCFLLLLLCSMNQTPGQAGTELPSTSFSPPKLGWESESHTGFALPRSLFQYQHAWQTAHDSTYANKFHLFNLQPGLIKSAINWPLERMLMRR